MSSRQAGSQQAPADLNEWSSSASVRRSCYQPALHHKSAPIQYNMYTYVYMWYTPLCATEMGQLHPDTGTNCHGNLRCNAWDTSPACGESNQKIEQEPFFCVTRTVHCAKTRGMVGSAGWMQQWCHWGHWIHAPALTVPTAANRRVCLPQLSVHQTHYYEALNY